MSDDHSGICHMAIFHRQKPRRLPSFIMTHPYLLHWLLAEFLEGFGNQGRGRRFHFSLRLCVLNGQFHCSPQALQITSCLVAVITNLFWRQIQGADLLDQDRLPYRCTLE
uniref:Uncharacterized protein n=1 Tax=Mustela putorius furo TaxID=9669 RepID=M3YSB0_MUSPF